MCVPGCQETVARRLSRRGLLKGLAGVTAGTAAFTAFPPPRAARAAPASFDRAVDLTHALMEDFPTFFGKPQLEMERTAEFSKDGFNMFTWHLAEHTGTPLVLFRIMCFLWFPMLCICLFLVLKFESVFLLGSFLLTVS